MTLVGLELGLMCLRQGDFIEAQSNLVEALSIYDPERDRKARFRVGVADPARPREPTWPSQSGCSVRSDGRGRFPDAPGTPVELPPNFNAALPGPR